MADWESALASPDGWHFIFDVDALAGGPGRVWIVPVGPGRARIITMVARFTEDDSLESRRSWPVRVYRLGEEPGDDQSRLNTAEQRLAMMWDLALEAWSLTGRPLPEYPRHETPVRCRPWRVADGSRA